MLELFHQVRASSRRMSKNVKATFDLRRLEVTATQRSDAALTPIGGRNTSTEISGNASEKKVHKRNVGTNMGQKYVRTKVQESFRVILFLCFSVLLVLRLHRLGKRELILVLFVRLLGLCVFRFVGFLFLLGFGKGYGLWLWHALDFSLTFFLTANVRSCLSLVRHFEIQQDYDTHTVQQAVAIVCKIKDC